MLKIKDKRDTIPQAFETEEKKKFVRGLPLCYFLAFVFIVLGTYLVIIYREKKQTLTASIKSETNIESPPVIQNQTKVSHVSKNKFEKWYEVIFPAKEEKEENKLFKYRELIQSANDKTKEYVINRNELSFESVRYIGLDPYSPTFSNPKAVVVGTNSAVGSSISKLLQSNGQEVIKIKGFLDIDFSSQDIPILFENITLTSVFLVYQPPLYHFSATDGASFIGEIVQNYTNGFFNVFHDRGVPVIFVVSPPYFNEYSDVSLCHGAKLVYLPHIIDNKEPRDMYNILLRSTRECRRIGKSHVEIIPGYDVHSITADEAAQYIVSLLNNFSPGRVVLKGKSTMKIEDALKVAVPDCKFTFVQSSHKFKHVELPKDEVVFDGEINSMIKSTFNDYIEKVPEKPYLTIIFTGRNDNYGGFKERAQNFLNRLGKARELCPLSDFDVMIADYNTKPSEGPLYKTFNYSSLLKGKVRSVIIPSSFHQRISKDLCFHNSTFLEFVAKNIAMRRCQGKYIVTVNPDSILSFQFIESLMSHPFNDAILYLASRLKLTEAIIKSFGFEHALQFMEEPWRLTRKMFLDFIERFDGNFRFVRHMNDSPNGILCRDGPGDFMLTSAKMADAINAFHEVCYNYNPDHFFHFKFYKIAPGFFVNYIPYHILHQPHPSLNSPFTGNDFGKYLNDMMLKGTSDELSQNDKPNWGYPEEKFEEMIYM
ncbi:Methyltransferase FkbM family [Histomonas meleagridis]|uniref:Methyltransferase FkbM family n=1 Tax=Histomonas meleagridis TaxID=135588 RepID=UPI0035598C48|nr:Methyltransferase FkbM family [Histomonas meleagridis]KAH0803829.1 Methyltransferase FkbM family [Histomonas meleagridis]